VDWDNLVADQVMILDRHFTHGRCGRSIDKVIVHHNGGDLSVGGCYGVWQARPASAHYQVCSDGTIGQLVWDRDTAWHASNWAANVTSIGIEHADCQSDPWRISDECLDQGAHLVAAVCRFYGLGRPEWGANLFGHSDFAATECPASLAEGGSQHDEYVARAQHWYDVMTGAAAPEEEDMTQDEHDMLAYLYNGGQVDNPLSWNFNWKDGDGSYTARGGNMYNCVNYTYDMVEKLLATEAAQTEAIKALAQMRGADPEAVAKAVSDAVEAKLRTIRLEVTTTPEPDAERAQGDAS
jgi:N-acetyl-anhydromuramyl-L-alanine amidase AmpD